MRRSRRFGNLYGQGARSAITAVTLFDYANAKEVANVMGERERDPEVRLH